MIKKWVENMKYLIRMRPHCEARRREKFAAAVRGLPGARGTVFFFFLGGGGAWRETFITHFSAIQSWVNVALPFRTPPALMYNRGLRPLAHMSHHDSLTLPFRRRDTWVKSLWSSSETRARRSLTSKPINLTTDVIYHCGLSPVIECFEVPTIREEAKERVV